MVRFLEIVIFKNSPYFLKTYPEYSHTISRFEDYIKRVIHSHLVVETRFLNKIEQEILFKMIPDDLQVIFSGGIKNATYQKALLAPKIYQDLSFETLVVLKTSINQTYQNIEHRHILGKLLNIGIQRNTIGDIIVDKNALYIACDVSVERLICDITHFKQIQVCFTRSNEEVIFDPAFHSIEKIIASLRLDVIVAGISNISRMQSNILIKAGHVKVNGIVCVDNARLCKEEDEIVIRKFGKFIFRKIIKTTKKDNLVVKIDQFL